MSDNKKDHDGKKIESQDKQAKKVEAVFKIAKGGSLTTKKGILIAGDVVKPNYFAGGQESFDALLKLKIVEKA